MTSSQHFPKSARVTRGEDFSQILKATAFAADDCLVVHIRRRMGLADSAIPAAARLGITIPRKTGNAVVRNRWKRWIRESFRRHREQIPSGLELVIRPRKDAEPTFHRIHSSMLKTIQRAIRKLPPDAISPRRSGESLGSKNSLSGN